MIVFFQNVFAFAWIELIKNFLTQFLKSPRQPITVKNKSPASVKLLNEILKPWCEKVQHKPIRTPNLLKPKFTQANVLLRVVFNYLQANRQTE